MACCVLHNICINVGDPTEIDPERDDGSDSVLRADVSKYRPEACKSEKSKTLKKIHKVALGKLIT